MILQSQTATLDPKGLEFGVAIPKSLNQNHDSETLKKNKAPAGSLSLFAV